MNIGRGLFRAWVFISVIWIIGVTWAAYVIVPDGVVGSKWGYQYRTRAGEPDLTRPFYETMHSPTVDTPIFRRSEYQSVAAWDKYVSDGVMIIVEMPDGSSLYLLKGMTKEDQEYLGRAFWDQRWGRYLDIGKPWLTGLIVPPLALLVLGWSLLWVGRGFAR